MPAPTAEELAKKVCGPCDGDVEILPPDEVIEFLESVPGWTIENQGERIRREWTMNNFLEGIAFFRAVADLAEREGHHPDLHLTGYRNVAIETTTHAIGGLSENDFVLAAKINEIPIANRS